VDLTVEGKFSAVGNILVNILAAVHQPVLFKLKTLVRVLKFLWLLFTNLILAVLTEK